MLYIYAEKRLISVIKTTYIYAEKRLISVIKTT